MFRITNTCLLVLSFAASCCCYGVKNAAGERKKVFLTSMAKGGSNLVLKALDLLGVKCQRLDWAPLYGPTTGQDCRVVPDPLFIRQCFSQSSALVTHAMYTPELAQELQGDEYCIVLNVRDPRGLLYSWARWIQRPQSPYLKAKRATVEEIMLDTLENSSLSVRADGFKWPPVNGLAEIYRAYLNWTRLPNCVLVCFEDLVGPRGGGSLERQVASLRTLSQAVGIAKTEQELIDIANRLYGGTGTFDRGKVDSWREVITGSLKELFVGKCEELLIEMGYESNSEW